MLNESDKSVNETSPEMLPGEILPEDMIETKEFLSMNRFMMLIIAMAMIPWIYGGEQIYGYNITGWSWVIPASLAGIICLVNIGKIVFPLGLWLPWCIILTVYWYYGQNNPDATQSLFQMLSCIAIGCAASIFRPDDMQLKNIVRWITYTAWVAWILLIIRVPMLLMGLIPGSAFLAPEMIGLLLFGACYASFYACGSGRHLYYYLAMLVPTIISLTRGPIVAMLSCLPLTTAPMTAGKRILLCAAMVICALVIFNTDRVQEKMFYSGRGELTDVHWGNPELKTHGRSAMWDVLWDGVEKEPWFGNGWNSHRAALLHAGFLTYLPHNDWLKLLYDMGILGTGLYLFTMVLQIFFLMRLARWSEGARQMLAYSAATAFIPYILIMLTDNVVLYVQYFGNLQFALIGIVYGAMRQGVETEYV